MDEKKIKALLIWRVGIIAKRIQDGEEATIDIHKAVTRIEELLDSKEKASVEALEELWKL